MISLYQQCPQGKQEQRARNLIFIGMTFPRWRAERRVAEREIVWRFDGITLP
jgi:hypothetical protein